MQKMNSMAKIAHRYPRIKVFLTFSAIVGIALFAMQMLYFRPNAPLSWYTLFKADPYKPLKYITKEKMAPQQDAVKKLPVTQEKRSVPTSPGISSLPKSSAAIRSAQ
jgi:hypothetical protein